MSPDSPQAPYQSRQTQAPDTTDPDHCHVCGTRGRVISSRNDLLGYRLRRHQCDTPNCEKRRWSSRQERVK
jgi:hypothetical protein